MIVVKLGGSIYHSPHIQQWLIALQDLSKQDSVIVVPGGGPFADQVRSAQDKYQFDDSTAHHMAILAMAQFGLVLNGMTPNSQCYRYTDTTVPLRPLSIWIPDASLLSEIELTHSWDISSDSLALWLANKLNAKHLVLIKSCDIPSDSTISYLTELEIIDRGFEQLYQTTSPTLHLINAKQQQQLAELLNLTPTSP